MCRVRVTGGSFYIYTLATRTQGGAGEAFPPRCRGNSEVDALSAERHRGRAPLESDERKRGASVRSHGRLIKTELRAKN